MLADPVGVIAGLVAGVEPDAGPGGDRGHGDQRRRRPGQTAPPCPGPGRAARRCWPMGAPRRPGSSADLLIALRPAGATGDLAAGLRRLRQAAAHHAAPRPGLVLRRLRAEREPCAACGNSRTVSVRDRDGQPRCGECPPGRRPGPRRHRGGTRRRDRSRAAGRRWWSAAVNAATAQAGQRRRLAWALQDRPELLTGAGAQAPVPSVLRLIDALCDAGATSIVRPPCPHCGRVIALVKPPSTGCGSAATAWPSPVPCPARAAEPSGRPPPATSTASRCVRTA